MFHNKTIIKICLGCCLLGLVYYEAKACDLAGITACTSILGRNTNVSMMGEGLSAIPTVEQLRGLCGSLTEFKNCYQPKAAACSNDVIFSMTFGTVEKTIDYLCEEGFNDIVEHAQCWNQSEVTVDTTNCHVIQSEMITLLQQQSSQLNSTQMRDSWCQILDNTTTCMSNAVERRCGTAPACIMHTMMSRALEGLAGLMKCPKPIPCVIPPKTRASTTPRSTDGTTTLIPWPSDSPDVTNTDTKLTNGRNVGADTKQESQDGIDITIDNGSPSLSYKCALFNTIILSFVITIFM